MQQGMASGSLLRHKPVKTQITTRVQTHPNNRGNEYTLVQTNALGLYLEKASKTIHVQEILKRSS